jgi:hypothetical protein
LKNIKLTWRKIDPNNFVESDTHWTCCKDKTWQGPSKAIVAWTHENIQTVAWLATEILNISCANWVLGHNNCCSGTKIGKVLHLFKHTLCLSYIHLYWNMSAHLVGSCCYHSVSVVITLCLLLSLCVLLSLCCHLCSLCHDITEILLKVALNTINL